MKDEISKTIDFRRWTIFDGQWSVVHRLHLKQIPLLSVGTRGESRGATQVKRIA